MVFIINISLHCVTFRLLFSPLDDNNIILLQILLYFSLLSVCNSDIFLLSVMFILIDHFIVWLIKFSFTSRFWLSAKILICIIFTSLCKNLVKLTWVLAEAFRCHGHHFQCLTVLVLILKQQKHFYIGIISAFLYTSICNRWYIEICLLSVKLCLSFQLFILNTFWLRI